MSERIRVLLVEDNELVAKALACALEDRFALQIARNVGDALSLGERHRFDVVVADFDLQDPAGRDGLWLLDHLGRPGLVLSGHRIDGGRYAALRKPASHEALIAAIENASRTTR